MKTHLNRIRDGLLAESYYAVANSPRFRAVERRQLQHAARAGMVVVMFVALFGGLLVSLAHEDRAPLVLGLDGSVGLLAGGAFLLLGRRLRHHPEPIIFVVATGVVFACVALGVVQPDLAVLDITLPDKNGLEIIKQVRLTDRKVKLLVVSMHDEAVYANRVLRLGGDGYIMKQEDPGEIINAIRDVLAGHIYVSEEMMNQTGRTSPRPRPTKETSLLDQLADLELEVLELLGQGKSNEEIASQLVLPQEKIDLTCAEVKQKLNLNSDNALIRYAVCWVESGAV